MTTEATSTGRSITGLHGLLLRLAGRAPDTFLSDARRWLSAGREAEVSRAVANLARASRIPVTDADAGVLADVLAAAGDDTRWLAELEIGPDLPPPYAFSPFGPEVPAEADSPYSADLTRPWTGPGGIDAVDRAAIGAAAAVGARGLWRSWRYPPGDSTGPPPRRVILAQSAADGEPAVLGAAIQTAMHAAGERDPQVEAYAHSGESALYQATALAYSALLWSATPAVELRMARLFDATAPDGTPTIATGHPALHGADRDRVLGYLWSGVPLLLSPDLAPDVVAPDRGAVVPMGHRTDGRWIWAEASAYYLAEHSVAPDPGLLADLAAAGYVLPEVDDVSLHRALHQLYEGPDER